MSDTLGGGLKVSGILSRAERLLKSDNLLATDFEKTVKFLTTVRDDQRASPKERVKAAEILVGIMARGDKLASELAAEERLDGGKDTARQQIVVKIKFDERG